MLLIPGVAKHSPVVDTTVTCLLNIKGEKKKEEGE
jgi:hypothetical protein